MSRAAEPPHPRKSYGLPALRPLHLEGKKSLPTTRTDDKLSPQPTQPPFPMDTLGDEAKSLPRKTIYGVPDTIDHERRPKADEDKNHHKRAYRSITRHPIVYMRHSNSSDRLPRGREPLSKDPRPVETTMKPQMISQPRQEIVQVSETGRESSRAQHTDAAIAASRSWASFQLKSTQSMGQSKTEQGNRVKSGTNVAPEDVPSKYGSVKNLLGSYGAITRMTTGFERHPSRLKAVDQQRLSSDPPLAFLQYYIIKEQLEQGLHSSTYVCARKETPNVDHFTKVWRFSSVPDEPPRRLDHCNYNVTLQAGSWDVFIRLRGRQHPNILSVLETFDSPDRRCLVTELASEGSLLNYIDKKRSLTAEESRKCFVQVLQGLKYLHGLGIVHRDIRPETIMLMDKELTLRIKVTRIAKPTHAILGPRTMGEIFGKKQYSAPELLIRSKSPHYGGSVDIWSLGIVLYRCWYGCLPKLGDLYNTESQSGLFQQQNDADRTIYPHQLDVSQYSAIDLMGRMLTRDTIMRIGLEECERHSWVVHNVRSARKPELTSDWEHRPQAYFTAPRQPHGPARIWEKSQSKFSKVAGKEAAMDVASAEAHRIVQLKKTNIQQLCCKLTKWLQLVEPPLKHGETRIRWRCRCGKELFDDFKELRPGAAEDLASTLRRMHSGPQSNPNRQHSGLQSLAQAVRQQISGRMSSWLSTPNSSLPIHNRSETSNSNTNIASLPNSKRLFLLSCIGYGRYTTRLSQQQLDDVRTDRQLFFLMRGQYLSKHWWRRLQSFRTLIGLDFVQFELHPRDLVDIRKRDDIPPEDRSNEYRYRPIPPEVVPPVGKNFLMHMYHHPDDAGDGTFCLTRFPKKTREQLQVPKCGEAQAGWGMHYVEGLHWQKVYASGMVVCLLSLVFGVAWSIVRNDVQGGFGVSAYMLAFLACTVGLLQAMEQ